MTEQFTLASWNIFQGLHFTSKQGAWVRNESVVDHLRALDADVLVIPEAWLHLRVDAAWAEELAATLGYELHQWVSDQASRERDLVPWRMVILSRIPARRLPDQVFPKFGSLGPRAIVRIELEESGLTVAGAHLYGIHLVLAGRLRDWFRERAEFRKTAEANDIIAGDMNMWGPVVCRDAPNHQRAVRGRTFPAQHPHSQIDHILVNDRVEVVASRVLPELGSDHRAISAALHRSPRAGVRRTR